MNDLFLALDYIGTLSLAITGASIAIRVKMDYFGVLFLAFLTAVGGGTTRDIILNEAVFWTLNPIYFYLVIAASFVPIILKQNLKRLVPILFFLDTLGLGFYVIVGTQKTLGLGFTPTIAVMMGITSGVLGGIIRSLFSKEVSILYNKELYASVGAITAVFYILILPLGLSSLINVLLSLAITISVRYLARAYQIKLPTF